MPQIARELSNIGSEIRGRNRRTLDNLHLRKKLILFLESTCNCCTIFGQDL